MYIGFGLFRHDISGVQCTSVKVSGTPERSKGAQVMWTGWTARCVCLAEIMFSGVPRKSCGRWVKGGSQGISVCICTFVLGKQKGKQTKHGKMTALFSCIFGLRVVYTRQAQRDSEHHILTNAFCSACCDITPTKTMSQTETAWEKKR